uniref:Diguanylate phosphodiesterase n=1 Tax=Cyanothece sp. (strain PCC 7425 / ATCC 29141) TaxID=395961 RepID=B8HQE3_CYAP4
MQLSPVSRYYVRKLLKKSVELIEQQQPLDALTLFDVDQALEDLQNNLDSVVKITELERLIHLHQGLSSQGSHFRNDVVELEAQVFSLLGLSSSTSISQSVKPSNVASDTLQSKQDREGRQLEFYLKTLNRLSQLSQRYLGQHIVCNYWQISRPAAAWLDELEVLRSTEFRWNGVANYIPTAAQLQDLQQWVNRFLRRCNTVLNNFNQMLKQSGLILDFSASGTTLPEAESHSHPLFELPILERLQRALKQEEFQIYYQPIVEVDSLKVVGFEALVRWFHPEQGLIPPIEFIPTAEETGFILELDQWVLRRSCEQLMQWQKEFNNSSLSISVNLSSQHLNKSDLVERVQDVLEATTLNPRCLKLEITEGAIGEQSEIACQILERLQQLNVGLNLDDFGTGYSSLSRLQDFPLNALKIDQAFVQRLGQTREAAEIVRTIIHLAYNMRMEVVAEGVENSEQLDILRSLGCQYVQGYYCYKPLSGQQTAALLSNQPGVFYRKSSIAQAA